MFENIVNQSVTSLLKNDIQKNNLPGAILFNGNSGSGKLSTALELARVLSCKGQKKGDWLCTCSNCLSNKALVNQNVIIAGSRDCSPEILASKETFINALYENAPYIEATRYLFIRSIRKLTSRFNQILWQGDSNISKIASVIGEIDEELENIDFPHKIPPLEETKKCTENLVKLCSKLESDFLYDSIPINNIRNVSSWARLKVQEGKKTIIIENADKMLENVRNALLKILEEPPEDTVFILTTSKKSAVMPTILSRVRIYNFSERSLESQKQVITRVFHNKNFNGTINDFLLNFLPVKFNDLEQKAKDFYSDISSFKIPEIQKIIKDCNNFEPRIMLKIFIQAIVKEQKAFLSSAQGTYKAFETLKELKNCYSNITTYNQSVQAAFENLVKELSKINKIYGTK